MSDEDEEEYTVSDGAGNTVFTYPASGGTVTGVSVWPSAGTHTYPSTTATVTTKPPTPAAAPAGRKSKIREAGKMLRAGRAGRMLLVALDEDGKSLWAAQASIDDLDLGFDDEAGVRVSLSGRFTEEPTFMDKDD